MDKPSEKPQDLAEVGASEKSPSLDLAFDWVKGVLSDQREHSKTLDSKTTTLFTAATAVLGIGASVLTVGALPPKIEGTDVILATIWGVVAVVAYIFGVLFAWRAWALRNYETLDNPVCIREWYWDMQPSQFKMELLTHIEDAYSKNETQIVDKADNVRNLMVASGVETVFLVISVFLFAFAR